MGTYGFWCRPSDFFWILQQEQTYAAVPQEPGGTKASSYPTHLQHCYLILKLSISRVQLNNSIWLPFWRHCNQSVALITKKSSEKIFRYKNQLKQTSQKTKPVAHRSGVSQLKICLGDFLDFSSCIDIQDVQLYLPSLPGKKDKQTSITNPFPNCRISMHLAGK